MEISLNKSKEVAHYASDISDKISALAHEMIAQRSEHDEIMESTSNIIENFSLRLNESEQNELAILIGYISQLIDNGATNVTSVLDLLEWSADKTEKYVIEYQDLARDSGVDVD